MPESPLVSLITPAFNAAPVIEETLQSVRVQSFRNFEALIVDDGSTDDTAALVRKVCATDARFHLISQPHAGLPFTRNAAIAKARGEFIAFLDADDVWFPEKLGRQMELFDQDARANFSYTNFYFWDGVRDLSAHYRDRNPWPDGDAARQLVAANTYGTSSVIVRREILQQTGPFAAGLNGCDDWDMWLRMTENGLWARGLRTPLMRYRRWEGSMSNCKLKMTEGTVLTLEKNLAATRRPELRPLYQNSLKLARSRLELAKARRLLESSPEAVPAAIWRAWRLYPRRLRWLFRFAMVKWPRILGGTVTARVVHRKLIRKW